MRRSAAARRASTDLPSPPHGVGRDATVRLAAGTGLLGAGTLHAVVVGPHYADDALAGTFFVLVELAQLATGLAVLVATGPLARWSLRLGAVTSAIVLATYVASRTVGLPIGPQDVPTIGVVDVVAGLLELVVVWAAVTVERSPGPTGPPLRGGLASTSVTVVLAVTLLTGYAVATGRGHTEADAPNATAADAPGPIGVAPGTVAADVVVELSATTDAFDAPEPFRPTTVELPAGLSAAIRFTNDDPDTRHNLSLYEPGSRGAPLFVGRTIGPGETIDLGFTTPTPGAYVLRCDLHPWMQAGLTTIPAT